MAIDYTDPIGQIRLLITDISEPYIFDDAQITAFYEMSSNNINLAAGRAYMTIAGNTVLLLKYVRTDDLIVDGAKVSAELRQIGKQFIDEGLKEIAADEEEFFEIVSLGLGCKCRLEYEECGIWHGCRRC